MSYLSRVGKQNLGHSLALFSIGFVPKVLIEIQFHANNFIVIPAQFVRARARQSDSRTSKAT
jgi:hypothetical protein